MESGRRVAVLDDDPTGVQSVHGVPVLTTWAIEDLRWALEQTSPTFYILTNSRSLAEEEAIVLNQQIARNLSEAAAPGTDFDVVSRSDSTLRGHYPAETDALAEVLREGGRGPDGLVLCPAFFEAGRITVDDIHWVRQDGKLVPAGRTEFARPQLWLPLLGPQGVGRGENRGTHQDPRGGERGPRRPSRGRSRACPGAP